MYVSILVNYGIFCVSILLIQLEVLSKLILRGLLDKNFFWGGGGKPMIGGIEGGHRLELKYIN